MRNLQFGGNMDKKNPKSYLGIVFMLGAVWGMSEAALGMGLRTCASALSGSIMTGVALFFIAVCWIISRNVLGVVILVLIASLFKMFDALLLSLPIIHGAVANPIFAFIMEGAAFLVIVTLVKDRLFQKTSSQAMSGGLAALMAVNLFPLVKFATGIPACVVAGTGYPLSLYYAYVAVAISLVTVPLGILVGTKITAFEAGIARTSYSKIFQYVLSPVTVILCMLIIVLIRVI
jgi:hypothetical protein